MIGQEIGNYKIIDIIGKGGMAVVYLGQHKALTRRTVAIKMLSASLESDSAFNERFFREAEVMDRLDHPNVVTLYDFIEHEGRYFIVMEYVSGKTLAHLIQERGGPLPLEEISTIFRQVFDAIAYAHDLGIVHRDLKPSNIMVDEKMQVKVTDFGIARLLGAGFEATLTATGMGMGSPYYMSPEQVLASKDRPITAASDIYSLGITLYQAVTGKVPFNGGDSLFTIMQAHLKEQPPPPRQFASHVGPQLERVILKAIEKRPEDRWKDCREFWKNLEVAISESLALQASPPGAAEKAPPITELPTATSSSTVTEAIEPQVSQAPKPDKPPLALILSILLVLLVGGGGAAYYFLSHRAEKAPAGESVKTPAAPAVPQPVKEASGTAEQEAPLIASTLKQARELLEADQYEKALAKAEEVLAIDPQNEDARLIKALALKARKVKEVQDLLLKGESDFASGRYNEALAAARAALEIEPDDPKAGELFERAKARIEEQERLRKALVLKLAKAEAFLESKAYKKASQVAKEVLAKDPQNKKAKEILAEARRGQKSKIVATRLREAKSLLKAGKHQLALSKLEEVLRLSPNHPEAKKLKQGLIARLKAKPDKKREIERRLALAEDLIAAEQYERAKIVLEKILDEDPDNRRAQDLLEMAHEGQKRKLLKQFLPAIMPGSSPQDVGIPGLGQPGQ